MSIDPYDPCPCGSGKKYKFCCRSGNRAPEGTDWVPLREGMYASADDPERTLIVGDMDTAIRLNEQGSNLLSRGRMDEARKLFERSRRMCPAFTPATNNLALCHFGGGDAKKAIEVQQSAFGYPLPNPFGHASLAIYCRYLPYREEMVRLAEESLRLATELSSPTVEGVIRTCEALARYGWHKEMVTLLEKSKFGSDERLAYFGGIAAANLGDAERAVELLRVAQHAASPDQGLAKRYVKLLSEGAGPGTVLGNWPYFTWLHLLAYWPPLHRALKEDPSECVHLLATVDIVAAMLDGEEAQVKSSLEALEVSEHPAATEILERVAQSASAEDWRRAAAREALERKTEPPKSREQIRVEGILPGRHPPVVTIDYEMTLDPPLTPKQEEKIAEAHHLLSGGVVDLLRAGKMLRKLVEQEPEFITAQHFYAVALARQSQFDKAEQILREILRGHPEFLTSAATLLLFLKHRGRLEEAEELLNSYSVPSEVHPLHWENWLFALLGFCKDAGKMDAAKKVRGMLEEFVPEHPWLELEEYQVEGESD